MSEMTGAWVRGGGADEERYWPRELSWLAFNRRVLEEAEDPGKPLIERAKFLAIVSSNLDEFTMVRLAELREEAADPAQRPLRRRVMAEVRRLVEDQYACWQGGVRPQLAREGMTIVPPWEWTASDRETLRKWYDDRLEPVLTPLAVDPARPFPILANRSIAVAVELVPEEGGEPRRALVAVPSGSRLIALVEGQGRWALAEDVVMAFLDRLFAGHRILARCLFRITRDGSLEIDEDQTTDLLSEIEQELSERDRSHAVRLEMVSGGDHDHGLQAWLLTALDLQPEDAVSVPGFLDLTVLFQVPDRLPRPELMDAPFQPATYPADWEEPFARIRQGELLLHHPFHSFTPIVQLVERAAEDPAVLAIKQTLYRVSGNSPIVKALIRAAQAGKQVTVLIELKARFDEAANIRWARALENAGAHVVYGLVGYKVHAKLLLVIRKEADGIRRYVHLGTGNYNDKTARLYTDLSYLTDNEAIGRDVAALFNMLTGYSRPPVWERLAVAPLTLRPSFEAWIRREIQHAKAGRPARIRAKFNSLVDERMCEELYRASQAGVEIDLIVRGMCILRAGVPGLSERIRVRSIVGRFLEHSRIYEFLNGGEPEYGISSADWMTRNLDRRVEFLVRIEAPRLTAVLGGILDACLADTAQARELRPDGTYVRAAGAERRSSQEELAAAALAGAEVAPPAAGGLPFTPRRTPERRRKRP
jgi:polyphosphate kinase